MSDVRKFYNTPSFWQILNIARRENSHSAFIAYYLNPQNNHSLGNAFLRLFLQTAIRIAIRQDLCDDINFAQRIMLSNDINATDVKLEKFMQKDAQKGRFDIFLKCILSPHDSLSSQHDSELASNEFIVIIENKISAKETKTAGKGQTKTYEEYLCQEYPHLRKLYILLSPDYNKVDIQSDKFIKISYQDLLSRVIEPILGNKIPNQEDADKLKDYIKCLSIPALEETTNKKSQSTILAMSKEETELLLDFWNQNEDLIKACLAAISNNDLLPFAPRPPLRIDLGLGINCSRRELIGRDLD